MAASQPVRLARIERFPDYQFGAEGSIWSRRVRGTREKRTEGWTQLHPAVAGHGYYTIRIFDGFDRRVNCQVHRLILEAFAGPAPDGTEGCHINGIRTDNRIENLYWGTRSQNNIDKHRHGTAPATVTAEMVREIRELHANGARMMTLSRRFGVSHTQIRRIVTREQWSHLN